ncbi:palmitoyltransferase PFA3 protein [Rutstroemia sp. NJR-2017a BBW]|nr:palmitoyltransferase PFA3 protein [Rutstroemia sp. NJR-2017a BBW]
MPRRWARKCERYCCVAATYFPLAFVYSITTWAVWVEATIGFLADGSKTRWIGKGTSFLGILLYLLLNWSYSTAVFTSPGTTTSGNNGYSALPTHNPVATSFTVKANGELRYLSGTWVWREILSDGEYTESLLPVNYVMLVVISGIIGLVLGGFTGWHILLASRGQTTIECLEKTRYLSPLRKSMRPQHIPGQQRQQSYEEVERARARARYEEYLDEQDSEKLPSAFDLGWKRNLRHLFGPKPLLWPIPICNTIGDGWSWEPSPKWLEARERLAEEREAQRRRESAAGWGAELPPQVMPPQQPTGAARHYVSPTPSRVNRSQSKADRILGRRPSQYVDMDDADRNSVSMQTFSRRTSDEDEYEVSSDEDEAERRILDRKATHGWPQKVGVVTNTLLGNTIPRQKDDARGWDGHDNDDVD